MKNIISIVWKVTLSCMLILSLIIIPASTELKALETEDKEVYVALGDSITTGYRLDSKETESFPTLLANANGWELHNLAKDGATTSDLLDVINTNGALLEKADYITITIGGNDLMDALYQFLTDKWNETNPDKPITLEDMKKGIATNFQYQVFAFSYLDKFNESDQKKSALATIESNLSTIDGDLSNKVNSNTKIVIVTQYNPYQFEEGAIFDTLNENFSKEIEELNTLIDSSNLLHMEIAPVAEKFAASTVNLCNATSDPLDLDFHPNAAGHRVIYQTILETLGITTYPLTVSNGSGSGEYAEGVAINVSANAPLQGQHFKTWTSTNGGTFADSGKSETTFTMPASATTITATYENHIAEADDGDCTTPILCSVCKEIMTPAQSVHSFGE